MNWTSQVSIGFLVLEALLKRAADIYSGVACKQIESLFAFSASARLAQTVNADVAKAGKLPGVYFLPFFRSRSH